ncbi:DNA-binding transcriptional LysR family regulator [Duganella sp. 1411]|jgi:DNA-binding transcriptional LysR family regulator|uniref:LysR family transcriptional regulator n=1 Tax=Duganella sp. 1411 TaxID=2806572 RepID=UPI001AE25187|nr:LysR family transcriptional regulator [Duganella sp. 1411]MBP1205054.1 DNA-binding transcriptional LysR family regulator [Duganella sp. 1411]
MEIHHLKTFAAVAREGSITRASERLFLSQPAVSAHVKAMEDYLGLTLFERTARGMSLTSNGQRILAKAERTLNIHRELLDEANHIKGRLAGRLRIGVGGQSNNEAIGRLVRRFSEHHPEVEVSLEHGSSNGTLAGIRNGLLDAGFYNESRNPDEDLVTIEVARFPVYVAAPAGMFDTSVPLDWATLADVPWIFAPSSLCCGGAAEHLFKTRNFRPRRIISIDRESVTRSMLIERLGVGLLHGETALEAQRLGEIDILCIAQSSVRNLFAHLASRAAEPLFVAINEALGEAGMLAA